MLVSIDGKVKIIVVCTSLLYFYTRDSQYMILNWSNISQKEQQITLALDHNLLSTGYILDPKLWIADFYRWESENTCSMHKFTVSLYKWIRIYYTKLS